MLKGANTSSKRTNEQLLWFDEITLKDLPKVGGKNASLGEMIRHLAGMGIKVPEGFAVTTKAFRQFVDNSGLEEKTKAALEGLDPDNPSDVAERGKAVRKMFLDADFPPELRREIEYGYWELGRRLNMPNPSVAIRSSATSEDLDGASFAGQHETILNVRGESAVLGAMKQCFASLFTDRAIAYRVHRGFGQIGNALSVGVQRMVRSDLACSGVMFTLDTESGFDNVVYITGSWGLGEMIVQGAVNPDQFYVFKPSIDKSEDPIIEKKLGSKHLKLVYASKGPGMTDVEVTETDRQRFVLTDQEIVKLARWACIIEDHYKKPMDIEWAKDGDTGRLFIVQARPETVQSRREAGYLKTYEMTQKGARLLTGLAIGEAIAAGPVCLIKRAADIAHFKDDAILVTEMTDPDWVPIMKRARGIVTDHGGRTCHAAIVSRELGIPAIVGTGKATEILKNGQKITISGAEGDQGYVYEGLLPFRETEVNLENLPETRTRIMMNIASPAAAFRWWRLPVKGIGLARMEFIINNIIKIHPLALLHFDQVADPEARREILALTQGYADKVEYFVDNLARGIAKIAASQYPEPVIVRMSDFKTNEYANLIGGRQFEFQENNPMLGFRGASRYYSDRYREGFALECRAMKRVREEMGLANVIVMIPFCRTLKEADRVLQVLGDNGLKRGEAGLEVYVMAEIPSNVILAAEFAQRFDGFSIGSNDLTQLVLGVDRDSSELSELFDERDEAVTRMIRSLIATAHQAGRKVGICGQAPSDYPDFAEFLVSCGIDSISLNPDSVIRVIRHVAQAEGRL